MEKIEGCWSAVVIQRRLKGFARFRSRVLLMATNLENFVFKRSNGTKRLQGLEKKIRELTILCDIDACLLCFDGDDEAPVSSSCYSWPRDSKACLSLIERYYERASSRRTKRRTGVETGVAEAAEEEGELERGLMEKGKEAAEVEIGSSAMLGEAGESPAGVDDRVVFGELEELLQRLDRTRRAVEERIELLNAAEEAEERESKTLWLFRT
ncbi:hypothetical protein RJ640_026416 [Escallonia rubra]|uniref:MADS-box domain-containing protein n=1 Tax=Escallonia rubra TaxID=112253 RepID=A0AA88QTN9_9ASTE|nr:hypothetical protein RJ640_026416 [Escallonia rubra]